MSPKDSGGGSRRSSVPFWAALLVLFGIVLLLNNLGYLPWGIWGVLWRFWPVILILIGINFFFGGTRPWLVLLVTILAVLGVLGVAYYLNSSTTLPLQTSSFSQPLGNLQKAEVTVSFGAGRLDIDSLPANSDRLASGDASEGAVSDVQRTGNSGALTLTMPAEWWNPGHYSAQWTVHLNPRIPLDLTLHTGANDTYLDLTSLKVGNLNIDTGASQNTILLPAAGGTDAVIKAGAAVINVTVPPGVAARIRVSGGLTSVNVDTKRFPVSGQYYQSPDYAGAVNRVDLDISAGAASVTVK